MSLPTIGRIVHYFPAYDGSETEAPFAAIVTGPGADGPTFASLHIFADRGRASQDRIGGIPAHGDIVGVPYSETPKSGHWMWPPRQ